MSSKSNGEMSGKFAFQKRKNIQDSIWVFYLTYKYAANFSFLHFSSESNYRLSIPKHVAKDDSVALLDDLIFHNILF